MDYNQLIRELESSAYRENRYLQSKICVRLTGLVNNKTIGTECKALLERANALPEPYNFDKKLVHPENISKLFEIYRETIMLIEEKLI